MGTGHAERVGMSPCNTLVQPLNNKCILCDQQVRSCACLLLSITKCQTVMPRALTMQLYRIALHYRGRHAKIFWVVPKLLTNCVINATRSSATAGGIARRATLVNSCYVSLGMGVRKVSNSKSDFQGHPRALVIVSFDRPLRISY